VHSLDAASPLTASPRRPLTKKELCALLPLSTGVVVFWFWVFLVIELAGSAGGSSGVAGTRTVSLPPGHPPPPLLPPARGYFVMALKQLSLYGGSEREGARERERERE